MKFEQAEDMVLTHKEESDKFEENLKNLYDRLDKLIE